MEFDNMDKPWRDKDVMEYLYHDQKLSQTEMAEVLPCTESCVNKWMNRLDIEKRDIGEIRRRSDDYGKTAAGFRTTLNGYEQAYSHFGYNQHTVYIHRLIAVAKFGFDEIAGKHVHHKSHIPWDNRVCNIDLADPGEHQTHHLNRRWGNKPLPEV
jgi:hypothetical protein